MHSSKDSTFGLWRSILLLSWTRRYFRVRFKASCRSDTLVLVFAFISPYGV